ncbi:MAG: TatD family hydrolase [Lysobacterales bacterium]
MIDSHCHLDAPEFDGDRLAVLQRARAAGVTGLVVPAVAREGWAALAELAASEAEVFPAYGLHPMFLDRHRTDDLQALEDWLDQHSAVAVGEAGLDGYVADLDWDLQCRYFEGQLRIARDRDLPVILHARRAHEAVLLAVRRLAPLRGVIHSYAGSLEQARQFIDAGFLLGFGGPITYPRARRLRTLVSELPVEALLLETDAPDQPLLGHQGARNEPAQLSCVLACAAQLRDCDPLWLADQTSANARRLFGLP